MADSLADLRTEFQARGYDYLETVRQNRYLNRAYNMLCEEYPFSFLEKEVTAQSGPLVLSDVREILYVVDATANTELYELDQRQVSESDPARANTGLSQGWYFVGDTLTLYPPDTAARLTVRYIQVPPELTADTDQPLVPQRYRNLITDAAVYLALKDNDEYDAARSLKGLYDDEVVKMISRLAVRSLQSPKTIARR